MAAQNGDCGALRRRRPWTMRLLRACGLLLLLLSRDAAATAQADCANASTVVVGATALDAVAYDASCTPRNIRVSAPSPAERSLNLSNLDVDVVTSYPSVYTMYLNHNGLETFQAGADNDMNHLELQDNRISDLTTLKLPVRLSYLDLRQNEIAALRNATPWPTPSLLLTLLLDGNSIGLIEKNALASLRSLQYLYVPHQKGFVYSLCVGFLINILMDRSLAKTALTSLDGIALPASLSVLNASSNALESGSSNFSNVPDSIQYLDLSQNRLTKFPTRVTELESLIELNLASNSITKIQGVQFPTTLKKLNLDGNALTLIEVCRSDMTVFAGLDELTIPTFKLTSCENAQAVLEVVDSVPFCVIEQCAAAVVAGVTPGTEDSTAEPSSTPTPTSASPDTASALNNGSGMSKESEFSSKAIVVIGGVSFFVGLLVTTFGFFLYRKRKMLDGDAKGKSPSNYLSFGMEQRTNTDRDMEEESDMSWVYDNPNGYPNAVALLEEEDFDKQKKHGEMDDLLVYEIPPEEIRMKGVLVSNFNSKPQKSIRNLFVADYQGYQVVLHALLRQKKNQKREERRFIEQIRLASTIEHPSMVQFIGLTFGSTSYQHQAVTQRWKFAVVFEYMHNGSLTSMFQTERRRREGKMYLNSSSASNLVKGGNIFSWFPAASAQENPETAEYDWRCKLSIALDIAMALVYLHSSQLVHGSLNSSKVLVNDHGEAKLCALDVRLPNDTNSTVEREGSIRQSAKVRMKRMMGIKPSSFTQSQLGSSLLHGGAALTPTMPAAPSDSSNAKYKETKSDVYAFGLLLWELDTMLSVDTMKDLATAAEVGEEHHLLKFTAECPNEIKYLARRCWNPNIYERPDALDLQEELVQLLEGRITTSSRAVSSWLRTTNLSLVSSLSSSSNMSSSSVFTTAREEEDFNEANV
ncbi:Serine/threonine protein kinase, partial [Globisporangium splendens]